MTKKKMARSIAAEMNLPQLPVLEVIQRDFNEIIDTLEKDGRIELRNFGASRSGSEKRRKPAIHALAKA